MGKGNRNKQARAQDRIDNPEAYLDERKKSQHKSGSAKKAKNTKSGVAIAVTCAILVLIIVATLLFSALSSAGVFLRMTDAVSTENFEVNGAMMNFFFNDYIMNWYSQYATYIQYGLLSVNFAQSLKNQPVGSGSFDTYICGDFEGTWYDYFLSAVSEEMSVYLAYAEGAKEYGLELTEEDKDEIDTIIDNLNSSLKQSNANYSTWYGPGVKERDVRKCYELMYLASNFNEVKTEELKEALEDEQDVIKQYPEDHKENFYSAEYLSYTITEKSSDYENDELFNNAVTKAKENAEKIAAAKNPEEFLTLVQDYIETTEEETESSTDKKEDGTTKEETTTKTPTVDDYKHTISYGTSSDLEKWIFEEEASENDGKVLDEEKTEEVTEKDSTEKKTVKTYTVTAYLVTNPSGLDYDVTKDLGYILTSDKAIAEAILSEFKAGSMSADALSALGETKYNALGESSTTELYFNSLEAVAPGYFEYYSYAPIDEWLETEDLAEGSCSGVIEIKPSSSSGTTYYAVCYFEKNNKEVWYMSAFNSIVTERFDLWYKGSDGKGGQLAKTPVTKNTKLLNDLYVVGINSTVTQ